MQVVGANVCYEISGAQNAIDDLAYVLLRMLDRIRQKNYGKADTIVY